LDVSQRENYGRVSGLAWGFGYLGGGLCLVLNLIMLQKPEWLGFAPGALGVGDCIIVAGLWWGVFALPTSFWIKEGRTPPGQRLNIFALTNVGWQRLMNTLRQVRRYRQLVRYLISFLLFNDGIETVIIMASIFGASEVGMSPAELVVFFVMVQGTALVGSFVFGWLADLIGKRNTLFITLIIWTGIVGWAYFLGWSGHARTEFYILGVLAGAAMGGSQAIARALQASFTPRAQSAEFFGFWAISGRFASIFGPLIYGGAIMLTGGVRPGILALGIFFIAGGIILMTVNEAEGMQAAGIQPSSTES
jgi:UMF1 family MFS transporter